MIIMACPCTTLPQTNDYLQLNHRLRLATTTIKYKHVELLLSHNYACARRIPLAICARLAVFCGIGLQLLFCSQISQRNLKSGMSHIPVDEIARAVSGAVTSVLSQVVEETSGN